MKLQLQALCFALFMLISNINAQSIWTAASKSKISQVHLRAAEFTRYLISAGSARMEPYRYQDNECIVYNDSLVFNTYQLVDGDADSLVITGKWMARTVIKRDSVYSYVNYIRPVNVSVNWIKAYYSPRGFVYTYRFKDYFSDPYPNYVEENRNSKYMCLFCNSRTCGYGAAVLMEHIFKKLLNRKINISDPFVLRSSTMWTTSLNEFTR